VLYKLEAGYKVRDFTFWISILLSLRQSRIQSEFKVSLNYSDLVQMNLHATGKLIP